MGAKPDIVPDPASLARAGADYVLSVVKSALQARGGCSLILGGGSTPKLMYSLLARDHAQDLDWSMVTCYFGDERCAGLETSQTNLSMARAALFDHLPLTFHPFALDVTAQESAHKYERILRTHFATSVPDLILLGMGADGHTLSLFPNNPRTLWNTPETWCIPATAPAPFEVASRVTVTLPFVSLCRHRLFLVAGADKAPAVAACHSQHSSSIPLPAALVNDAHWIIDRAAAAALQ